MKKIDYNDRKLVCIPVVTSFRILMAPDMERNVRFDVSVWLYAAGVCSDIKICAVYFTFAFERRGKPARIPISPIDWQKDSSTVLCRKEVCCFFWEMC